MANNVVLPNLATPVRGTMKKVLDNDTTPRDKISLNGLRMTKDKNESVSMMMIKTGLEVSQPYTVFNYGPPRPQK